MIEHNPILYQGDNLDILAALEPESVDAICTDPPYGIGFMGREWDTFKPAANSGKKRRLMHPREREAFETNPNLKGRKTSPAMSPSQIEYDFSPRGLFKFQRWCQEWAQACRRVLKPGGHLLAFGAPRSYHRLACGIEDAGFEIRDEVRGFSGSWLFGSGFPKSVNIRKALGARGLICVCDPAGQHLPGVPWPLCETCGKPVLPHGLGSGLKPTHEPIVLARKPLRFSLIRNVLELGTGAIQIDGCRVSGDNSESLARALRGGFAISGQEDGRWPTNSLLDEATAEILDAQTGELVSGANPTRRDFYGEFHGQESCEPARGADSGGASRFFPVFAPDADVDVFRYEPKPSRAERDLGCDDLEARSGGEATGRKDDSAGTKNPRAGAGRTGGARNIHPTVKPVALMRWLVRLVAVSGQVVLDPFLGSGTTGMAAKLEGCRFIGIEREPAYVDIATRRIAAVTQAAMLALAEQREAEDVEPTQAEFDVMAWAEEHTDRAGADAPDLPCGTESATEGGRP